MPRNNSDLNLEEIERFTINHYEENAESFRAGTMDHDVSQSIAAFLGALPQERKRPKSVRAMTLVVLSDY